MVDLTHEPDLGYFFHPSTVDDHPGHPRLDVIIPATPTQRHYDPQKVQFFVSSARNEVRQLTVHHPWTQQKHYDVCAGLILICDRKDKRVEAFSFGGDLEIMSDKVRTVCALTSPAPIFPLFTTHDLPTWLVSEFEILLAEQEADWDPKHPHDYEMHLASVDPFLLYACSLRALREKGATIDLGRRALAQEGYQFVQAEIERLQREENWPLQVPPLDELL